MADTARITLGVCGGVAAYRAAELVRVLQQRGLDVHVVMTRAAEEFVRPLTFAALTGHKVITSLWPQDTNADDASGIEHIAEAQATDVLVVAPATAHVLAKSAHGLADDFLSTLFLATTAPVVMAPAMNINMWRNSATQANLQVLRSRGVHIVQPGSGYLACGMTGEGRLAPIEDIAAAVIAQLHSRRDLEGETVLITAGGTREAIDPVRFLGNRSSGKMGYALAEAAAQRGAKVILVTAPTALDVPFGCDAVHVQTAAEMRDAVVARLPEATIVIKAAAVADYRARTVADQKLKRSGPITLELEPTEDIVKEVVRRRKPGTLVIAFAAETEALQQRARAKLEQKGVDAIVANDVSQVGLGFDSDRNAVIFITRETAEMLPESSKRELAEGILNRLVLLRAHQMSIEAPALLLKR